MKIKESQVYKQIASDAKASILDWGCGGGKQIDELMKLGCRAVTGLEVDPVFERENVVISADSIGWLERHSEEFDLIVARESFYYIEKDSQRRLWSAFYSALTPGGKIFVIAFNGALETSRWIPQKDLAIKLTPNEILLQSLAIESGFGEIKIFGLQVEPHSFRGKLYYFFAMTIREYFYKFKYLSERGIDSQNPKHFTKSLLLVGSK